MQIPLPSSVRWMTGMPGLREFHVAKGTWIGTSRAGHSCCRALHAGRLPWHPIYRSRASGDQDGAAAPSPVLLPALASPASAASEADWPGRMVTLWLDEEWTPLPEHAALGRAVCESVERLSSAAEGPLDASGLVIDLAGALAACDYHATFVNAFDVANKAVELLMLRAGHVVCCVPEAEQERTARHAAQLDRGGPPS
ncbi:hypothetical protein ACKKBF_B17865 [Auxenochlorella protothecoides x Auxenochlorella symbiontica]